MFVFYRREKKYFYSSSMLPQAPEDGIKFSGVISIQYNEKSAGGVFRVNGTSSPERETSPPGKGSRHTIDQLWGGSPVHGGRLRKNRKRTSGGGRI